jgi:hypothetical protein
MPIVAAVIVFVLLPVICQADFIVSFKDGSQHRVSKIEFKGEKADLYLSSGLVMTVPANAIDYKVTGIEPPGEDEAITVYGKGPANRKKTETGTPGLTTYSPVIGPSQQELKALWDKSERTAVALENFGPVRSGDTVRIVSSTQLTYTIVYREANGTYGKRTVNEINFSESFKMEPEKPKPLAETPEEKPDTPEPAKITATPTPKLPRVIPPAPEPAGERPTLLTPFLLSIALILMGLGLTIVLSRSPASPGKRRK